MFKSAIRAAPRRIVASRSLANPSRRFLSTAPPSQKSRSWKSSAARWALAAGGIYYYNTSNVFAEEPEAAIQQLGESIHSASESNLPTVDAIVEEKRRREAQLAAEQKKEAAKQDAVSADGQAEGEEGSLDGLEEEADQQGAFNPETGEINWDCPCLGGMAHGPCGEEFRAAFSCFVYSKEEPKGVECIEKFKGMQDCFREHPEMYGSELEDDEDEVEEELRARDEAKKLELGSETQKPSSEESPAATQKEVVSEVEKLKTDEPHRESKSPADIATSSGDEGDELVPRAAHDASSK